MGRTRSTGWRLGLGASAPRPSLAAVTRRFAQVEVDDFQINLDRFSLFFPEKRPFFLENAGQFSVGVDEEIELFFSRRIGIGPNGPIDGGVRLSGKVGKTHVGFLAMRSQGVSGIAPENDFTVARVNRELPNRSSIGAVFTRRSGDGSLGNLRDSGSTYGLDGRWGIGRFGQVKGFVAATDTSLRDGAEGDEFAFRLGGAYDSEDWSFSANVTEVGEDFDPQVGFLSRRDYRKLDSFVLRRLRPKDFRGLHELRPHVSYRGFWNPDGFQETGFLHLDNHWEWPSGFEFHTGVNFTLEGVREPFEISGGVVVPEGTYEHSEVVLVLITNEGRPLSFEMRAVSGGFFGGDRLSLSPTLRWRLSEAFTTDLDWRYNDVDLPGGAFETNLGRLRVSYSFTPRIFVQALAQYNDRADVTSVNLRLGWLQRANAGLFVVYNELEDRSRIGAVGGDERERTVIVKYSRLIDPLR